MVGNILQQIQRARIVSIIRGIGEEKILKTVQALYEGGITAVEITFNTPGAAKSLEMVKKHYEGKMTIGAGTVLDPETARIAVLNGADFILSPSLNRGMIEMCSRYGKLAVPGVLTPTEIVQAWEAGAHLVKVFPARTFGPAYIKDVKGPLNHVEIMAVGGVSLDNIAEFIHSGALAAGIGSELVNSRLVEQGDFQGIAQNARRFVEKVSGLV